MNRNIPLLPTSIFLLFIFNAIYVYTSRVDETTMTPLQQVVEASDGTVWALFGDSLIDLSDQKETRLFSQHGFEYHVGQMIPLQSGEWIINAGAQSGYVKRALVRSLVEDNSEYQSSGSLLKCSSDFSICQPWGETELQFERAFEGIELDGGRTLLFKAEQRRIFLVDTSGIILNELQDEEMWFGVNINSSGNLIGLNTSRNELSKLIINENKIKMEKLPIDFQNLTGDVEKISSPSKIVEHKASLWLLGFISTDEVTSTSEIIEQLVDMNPTLLSIDNRSGEVRQFPYSFRADAEIERIGDVIYFTDFSKHEIKKFDLISESMGLVQSNNLQAAFQLDQDRVDEEKTKLFRALFQNGLAALAALIWLIIKSTPITSKAESDNNVIDHGITSYNSSDQSLDRELAHIAKVFAKKKLTRAELSVIAPFKKVDDNYIYYPNGIFSKGKLIPNAETLVSLYKWGENNSKNIRRWVLTPLFVLLISLLIYKLSHTIGLILFTCSLLIFLIGIIIVPIHSWIKRRSLLNNLLEHDSRLSFTDVIERMAKVTPKGTGEALMFSGGSLLVIQLTLFFMRSDEFDAVVSLATLTVPPAILFLALGLALRSSKNSLSE